MRLRLHLPTVTRHHQLPAIRAFKTSLSHIQARNSHPSAPTTPLVPCLSILPPSPWIHQIKQTHAHIVTLGLATHRSILAHLLVACAVSLSPSPHYARAIFDCIDRPSAFTRNNMIRCYAKGGMPSESLVVYSTMCRENQHPNKHTFPFVLQACSKTPTMHCGVQIHAHAVKFGFSEDVFVRNALIHFYSAFCDLDGSQKVFDESPRQRDIVTWNAILAAYARDGQIDVCERLFEEMPHRDSISWSTVIMGYVQGGRLEEGLELFKAMIEKGIAPNEATLATVLSASAQLGLLEYGRLIHSTMKAMNFPMTVALQTALIDMYAKCGCIDLSRQLFNEMPRKDVFVWNSMIFGLAIHGHGKEAVRLFQRFTQEGLRPMQVTFVGVLTACSHAGLVDEGRHYFKSMTENYGIEPEMEHYGCMVDLLGRAGFVEEALELIGKMTVAPDPVIWGMLLGACRVHRLNDLGETIGRKLIELDPNHDGHYVSLANIYARSRKWQDVINVRRLMVDRGASKVAGWSLIEAQGRIHQFVAGDRTHGQSKDIYKKLEEIGRRLAGAGYSPDVSEVLHDIGEEEKVNAVWEHSERLAIAFGLMVTEDGSLIRIVKNLRVGKASQKTDGGAEKKLLVVLLEVVNKRLLKENPPDEQFRSLKALPHGTQSPPF
ncbi:hypothetical protein ACLOJK_016925 [Asimina triloba]